MALNERLKELYARHGHHMYRVMRVLAVGGVGFIIQSVIFEVFGIRLGLVAASTAVVIGGECAILSNFFLNNRFSFRDAALHAAPLLSRIVRFHVVSSGSLATQWTFLFVAERLTQDPLILRGTYILGVGIGFLMNYSGYYFFVWRKRRDDAGEPSSR